MKLINKILFSAAASVMSLGALTSCDNGKIYDMDHLEADIISEISFAYEGTLPLQLGVELPLEVKVVPETLASDVIYSSTNEEVAYVDANGTLHCVGLGEATVTATPSVGFGVTAKLNVVVVEEVVYSQSLEVIGVNELAEYHYLGDEFQLTTVHSPANHTYQFVDWSSSNPDVIAIDAEGNVTCGKTGSAVVTATTRFPDTPGIKGQLTLVVSESADVDDIEIAPITEPICLERPFDLDVTYYPEYGNPASVEWESDNEDVAVVTKGRVIPIGFGNATLTGTCPSGKSKSISITVTPGWHIWDMENKFSRWAPSDGSLKFDYSNPDYVTVPLPNNNGKLRADLKYACDANSPLWFNFGEYPVIAFRTTIPADGRNTFDMVDLDGTGGGNPQCNVGQYATGNPITLDDGSVLIYVDMTNRDQYKKTGNVGFKTFQLKVADIPAESTTATSYRVYWIRTFKNVDEMRAFAEAEVANGK